MNFNKLNDFGFTLVEILMVIVLVGIISAVTVPRFIDFSDDAKIAVTTEKLNALKIGIMGDSRLVSNGQYLNPGFYTHIGALPTTLDDLVTQGGYSSYNPFNKLGWRGPYVSNASADWKKDAWSNNIVYDSGARTLTSNGPDGVAANGDDITINF